MSLELNFMEEINSNYGGKDYPAIWLDFFDAGLTFIPISYEIEDEDTCTVTCVDGTLLEASCYSDPFLAVNPKAITLCLPSREEYEDLLNLLNKICGD